MEIFTLTPLGIWTTALMALLLVFIVAGSVSAVAGFSLAEWAILVSVVAGTAVYLLGIPVMLFTEGLGTTVLYSVWLMAFALAGVVFAQILDLIAGY